jgi:hypothetical protein
MPRKREPSVVVDRLEGLEALSDNVPAGRVQAKTLFKPAQINRNKCTSDYNTLKVYLQVLIALLTLTKGRQLTHNPFAQIMRAWLHSINAKWSMSDIDDACDNLRVLIRSLRKMRNDGITPPLKFGCLNTALSLIAPPDKSETEPPDKSETEAKAAEDSEAEAMPPPKRRKLQTQV